MKRLKGLSLVLNSAAALIVLLMAPFASQAQDLGVCDAYQQLLMQTKFDVTPFCGRPDDGIVHADDLSAGDGTTDKPLPGFVQLKRDNWDIEKVWPLFTHVYEFMLFDDQSHVERFFTPVESTDLSKPGTIDEKRSYWGPDPDTKDDLAQTLHRGWAKVWSYAQPIDIENDGSSLNLVIWQGYGVRGGGHCGGGYYGHPWTDSYSPQQAFVISPDGKTIDEERTRAIFGAPLESSAARLTRRPSNSPFLPAGAIPFEPLAGSIGIFEYRGRFYIQTEDRPNTKRAPLPPVVVYLRDHGHTTKLCSLHLKNEPVPEDD